MERERKRQKAFTLVELMVVVTILGILASVVSLRVVQYLSRARVTKARADMNRLMTALKLFSIDSNGEYPEDLAELTEATETNPEGYISGIPKDPWGNDYGYWLDEELGYELVCYGRDGTEGGEGEDEDITASEMGQPAEDEELEGSYEGSG
jgi:general secretion pathway protein G